MLQDFDVCSRCKSGDQASQGSPYSRIPGPSSYQPFLVPLPFALWGPLANAVVHKVRVCAMLELPWLHPPPKC